MSKQTFAQWEQEMEMITGVQFTKDAKRGIVFAWVGTQYISRFTF